MMDINVDLLLLIIVFCDKKSSRLADPRDQSDTSATDNKSAIKSEIIPNQQLAEEFRKPIPSSFKDNI